MIDALASDATASRSESQVGPLTHCPAVYSADGAYADIILDVKQLHHTTVRESAPSSEFSSFIYLWQANPNSNVRTTNVVRD